MASPRNKGQYVSLWAPPEMGDRINRKALRCGMSRSDWIRSCIQAALDADTNVPPSGPHCPLPKEDS